MDSDGKKAAIKAVTTLRANGFTDMYGALKMTADVIAHGGLADVGLTQFGGPRPMPAILLLSDGGHNGSTTMKELLEHLKARFGAPFSGTSSPGLGYPAIDGALHALRGVLSSGDGGHASAAAGGSPGLAGVPPIYALGIGADHDAVTLASLACATGGQYAYLKDAEDIASVFGRLAGCLQNVLAYDVAVTMTVPRGLDVLDAATSLEAAGVDLKVARVDGPCPVTFSGQTGLTMFIGRMGAGEVREAIITLHATRSRGGIFGVLADADSSTSTSTTATLLKGSGSYTDITTSPPLHADMDAAECSVQVLLEGKAQELEDGASTGSNTQTATAPLHIEPEFAQGYTRVSVSNALLHAEHEVFKHDTVSFTCVPGLPAPRTVHSHSPPSLLSMLPSIDTSSISSLLLSSSGSSSASSSSPAAGLLDAAGANLSPYASSSRVDEHTRKHVIEPSSARLAELARGMENLKVDGPFWLDQLSTPSSLLSLASGLGRQHAVLGQDALEGGAAGLMGRTNGAGQGLFGGHTGPGDQRAADYAARKASMRLQGLGAAMSSSPSQPRASSMTSIGSSTSGVSGVRGSAGSSTALAAPVPASSSTSSNMPAQPSAASSTLSSVRAEAASLLPSTTTPTAKTPSPSPSFGSSSSSISSSSPSPSPPPARTLSTGAVSTPLRTSGAAIDMPNAAEVMKAGWRLFNAVVDIEVDEDTTARRGHHQGSAAPVSSSSGSSSSTKSLSSSSSGGGWYGVSTPSKSSSSALAHTSSGDGHSSSSSSSLAPSSTKPSSSSSSSSSATGSTVTALIGGGTSNSSGSDSWRSSSSKNSSSGSGSWRSSSSSRIGSSSSSGMFGSSKSSSSGMFGGGGRSRSGGRR